jgi:hypothetical protein
MPNWKKVVVSGSNAILNSVTASFTGSLTGALIGTASWATNATNAVVTVTTANSDMYLGLASTTGVTGILADTSGITYNPSTNTLGGAYTSTGTHKGTFQVNSINTAGTYYPVFAGGAGDTILYADGDATFNYNPGGNLLSVGAVSATSLTGSHLGNTVGTASWATNSSTASFVNTLNQNVLITGSVTIGSSSLGPSENTLTLGARDSVNEGGQIGFNAPGGTYTSASFIDLYQNRIRILKGTNASSTGEVITWNLGTLQMVLPAYTNASSFPGTATANLAVDSSGNVITVSTAGGAAFPFTGSALITGSLGVTGSTSIQGTLNQGSASIASGLFSHVQGLLTTASGIYSHAEGDSTHASGSYSHAEGSLSRAFGNYSHAEGSNSLAEGNYSHAEGTSLAIGDVSHAEGVGIAVGDYSHAEGTGTTSGSYSHAEGNGTITSGSYSHAEGSTTNAIGNSSHAEGSSTKTGITTAYASTVSSGVVTLNSTYGDVSLEFATDNNLLLYDTPFDAIYGTSTFIISQSYFSSPNTIVELVDTSVTTTTAYVGSLNYGVSGWIGDSTIPGDYSHAEGNTSAAVGGSSHAEGRETIAVGASSHAEGRGTNAIGGGSHAEGYLTIAVGGFSHAEGVETQAIGDVSHAEGEGTIASGFASHAEGAETKAIGPYSHAEGRRTSASGDWSHAEGANTKALGTWSHAEGLGTVASGSYQHVQGQYNISSSAESAFIIGNGINDANRSNLVFASGSQFQITGSALITGSLGVTGSFNQGSASLASGLFSHVQGLANTASGIYSHAEGNSTHASGSYSHAEGLGTIASGSWSHAEGRSAISIGAFSHAEGRDTVASGSNSHAEGNNTQAIGDNSHAEGAATQAIGQGSHAEGFNTVASGSYQHVQGQYNLFSSAESAFIIGNGTSGAARSNLVFASGSQFQITGSLRVSGSITGSLFGTASWAQSASNAIIAIDATSAEAAKTVRTISSSVNAVFYPTFVDSNNTPASNEALYTSDRITFNPGGQVLNVRGLSAQNIQVTSSLTVSGSLIFTPPTSPAFNGEIVRFGAGTLTTGQLYFLSSSGTWSLANANSTGSSTGMLGIAVGSSPTTQGLLVRGYAASSSYTTATGSILYVATSSGLITATPPSSSNHVVRVIGYKTTLSDTIYFTPDPTWVTLA